MIFEDVLRQQGFAATRAGRHSAQHHPRSEDDLRVAREEVIRDRGEIESGQLARILLLVRDSADQNFRQRRRFLVGQRGCQPAPELVAFGEVTDDRALRLLVRKNLFQEVLDVVNLIGNEAHQLLKPPVFLARNLAEQDVVE